MSTSGSTTWALNRDQIIAAALRKLGALAAGQTLSPEDITNGTIALNATIASLQGLGMPLWARTTLQVSLTAGVRSYTIGVGKTINTPYPLKLQQATLTDIGSGSKFEVKVKSVYDLNILPIGASGQPVHISYQPLNGFGVVTTWPTPDASAALNKRLELTYQRPFEDMVNAGDTLDFPKEWTNPIIYFLAVNLAPEWGVPNMDRSQLLKEAQMHLETALAMGGEDSSMFFSIERW